ncbi:DUF1194 domain-containing protein [Arenibacterium halophilum]|nr:DUF1194 domain-containing protein [Arenibacterium halophilum]
MDRRPPAGRYGRMWLRSALFTLAFALPLSVRADPVEVDVELFLAVDVSRSMSPQELEIQRRGYAAALSDPEVIDVIAGGMIGRIALTYVEWAGDSSQTVIVPWTLIDSPEAGQAVAERLTAWFSNGMRRTSIAGVLDYAADAFETNSYTGLRRVIDVSGDGPNNQGRPVLDARADVQARGITINGLPLMTQDAFSLRWGIPDLDAYYLNCVIGGPGAFVLPVLSWDQFADSVKRKLILEIAARPAPAPPERIMKAQGYDCLIGEKKWESNQFDFNSP